MTFAGKAALFVARARLPVGLGLLVPSAAVASLVLPQGGASPSPATAAQHPAFSAESWFLPDEPLLGFVEIPEGPFTMGSDPSVDSLAYDTERWSATAAQGTIALPAFYIGRYEVTVAQFRAFVESTGYAVDGRALEAADDYPVTYVSWPDALAYARWLERTLRESSRTPAELGRVLEAGWRVTLPSEAEWEKAARGTDGRIYPWGNEPRRDRANYRSESAMPVGSFPCPECAYGLADMGGNVWEYTRSPYQPYPYDETDDMDDLEADALWVMRGGSFGDTEQNVRAAIRGGVDPGARRNFVGFRLVIAPSARP